MIDVSNINFSENILLVHLMQAFSWLQVYARHLLYYFISFEIILVGLGWAIYQAQFAEKAFSQLLKIGLILFIVNHYGFVLNGMLSSTILLSKHFNHLTDEVTLFNPGVIWQYGYNQGVNLLQTAMNVDGFALPLLLIILGMAILLVFGFFGIQICLEVLAFYCIATISLLTLPLASFSPLGDFFSKTIQGLLRSSVALMVQLLLVYAAIQVWSSMGLNQSRQMDMNTSLGMLFSGLLFVLASLYLPRKAKELIGAVQWQSSIASSHSAHAVSRSSSLSSSKNEVSPFSPVISNTQITQVGLIHFPSVSSGLNNVERVKSDFIHSQIERSGLNLDTLRHQEIERQRLQEIKEIKEAFLKALTDKYQEETA